MPRNPNPAQYQIEKFKMNNVAVNEIHLLPELLIPLSQNEVTDILEKLKSSIVLKKILKKKKTIFRNPKNGEVIQQYEALKANDQLYYRKINQYPNQYFVDKKICIRLINLYLTYEQQKKANRSQNSVKSRRKKLIENGWEIVENKETGVSRNQNTTNLDSEKLD